MLIPLGLIPAVRRGEGVQARFMLAPGERTGEDTAFSITPSVGLRDRWRTVLWLEARLLLGVAASMATVWLPTFAVDLTRAALGHRPGNDPVVRLLDPHWTCALLVPLPLIALYGVVVGLGELTTVLARQLLGPSSTERLAALEERTEQLLERNRIARELHDSIGHALTVAVVQAGAARAAGDLAFTGRALVAIEETGRAALEDLERVLGVLREAQRPVSSRPTLTDADRLLESARTSGAKVDAEVTGPVETVPGPVSREGYRILQESLTNVLRHAGGVPVRVRIEVRDGALTLEIRNPLPDGRAGPGRGSGLRGIRERAALLGGSARTGPHEGDWQVHAELPLS
jgi:signal transduction histidine kinase